MAKNLTTEWTTERNMIDISLSGDYCRFSDLCYDDITKIVYIKACINAYVQNHRVRASYSYCNYIGPNGRFCKYDEETGTIYEL